MGLSSRLIIGKGKIESSYEDFIKEMGFHEPHKVDEKSIFGFRVLPDHQIAVGECNGFVFICHHELPMYLIENEMSRNDYGKAYNKLNTFFNQQRFVAAIFQSSINGFGYGIYDEGEPLRAIMGDYEGLIFQSGIVQEEEQMIKKHPDPANTKALYSEKEFELHAIGVELTQEVLTNYCGQDFLMDGLSMSIFKISI